MLPLCNQRVWVGQTLKFLQRERDVVSGFLECLLKRLLGDLRFRSRETHGYGQNLVALPER